MGTALRPGNEKTFALETETDRRQFGAWMKLTSGVRGSGCICNGCRLHRCDDRLPSLVLNAMQRPLSAFRAKALGGENNAAPRVINTDKDAAYPPATRATQSRGSFGGELPASTQCSTLTTSWSRITGPSNAGCVRASISGPFGPPGVQSPAMKRFI